MTEDKQPDGEGKKVHTGGGSYVGDSVTTGGGDFVGRDKVIQFGRSLRDEQYKLVVNWEKNKKKPRLRGFDLTKQDFDIPLEKRRES